MARSLKIHFHVPADQVPAPHHVSGVVPTAVGSLGTGRGHVMACDPTIVQSEWDNATGEPHAVVCRACRATEVWKAAAAAMPDPRTLRGVPEVDPADLPPGCCG